MGSVIGKKKNIPKKMKDYVSWFEIPAINFEQDLGFYNHIYGINMESIISNKYTMAFFPADGGIGRAVVSVPCSYQSEAGPMLYLNGGNDLNDVLNKVEEAGGRIIMSKLN